MASKNKEPEVKFDPEVDIGEQIKRVLEKKIRNLEKRKVRLEIVLKKKEKGEKMEPEQEEALKAYPGVIEMTQILQSLSNNVKQLFIQQARWLKKESKKINSKKSATGKGTPVPEETSAIPTPPVIEKEPISVSPEPEKKSDDLPKHLNQCVELQTDVYRLLQCFGEDSVRSLFLEPRGQPGVIVLTQDDLDRLDELHGIVNPLAEETDKVSAHDSLGSAAFMTTDEVKAILGPVHHHWTSLYLHSKDPLLEDGTDYDTVALLCEKLIACDFFKSWKPSKSPVEEQKLEAIQYQSAPVSVAKENTNIAYSVDNGYTDHRVVQNVPKPVEALLQNFGTPFQFMQNPSTPQPPTPVDVAHTLPLASQAALKPAELLQKDSAIWASPPVTVNESVAPPPGLHDAGDKVASIDWNSAFEPQAAPEIPKPANPPALIAAAAPPSAPPAISSWADKVRHNAGPSAVTAPIASYKPSSAAAGGYETSEANFTAVNDSVPAGAMDVFDTASQSQFISSHPEGNNGRRSGHRQSSGPGRGRGGNRNTGGFRGGGRGSGKGQSFNNYNGQRPTGRALQN